MIGENASVINIHFMHVFFIKLTLPPFLIDGLQKQRIKSFNRLLPKNVGSLMRVSTVYYLLHLTCVAKTPNQIIKHID